LLIPCCQQRWSCHSQSTMVLCRRQAHSFLDKPTLFMFIMGRLQPPSTINLFTQCASLLPQAIKPLSQLLRETEFSTSRLSCMHVLIGFIRGTSLTNCCSWIVVQCVLNITMTTRFCFRSTCLSWGALVLAPWFPKIQGAHDKFLPSVVRY
jgi:hypothetical protein